MRALGLSLLLVVSPVSLAGADPAAASADSTAPRDATTPDAWELARRIDLLARELDDLRLGEVASPPASQHGLGPAASKVYAVDRGVSIGGYGEMLYENFSADREDGQASGKRDQMGFLRQILPRPCARPGN